MPSRIATTATFRIAILDSDLSIIGVVGENGASNEPLRRIDVATRRS
jgi:hypothetical protein